MTKLVVSVSLLFGVYQGAIILFPADQGRRFPGFFDGNAFDLSVVNLQWHDAFTIVAAVLVALFLRTLLFGTRTGIAMRAVVDDRPLAQLTGSRPDRSAMLAWALGTSLAALSGILLAGSQGVLKHLDLTLLVINAYAAAMIGRLRSLPLTFVGRADPRPRRVLRRRLPARPTSRSPRSSAGTTSRRSPSAACARPSR